MIYWTHPVKWVTANGILVGEDGSVWMYRKMPTVPLFYADGDLRNRVGNKWHTMLQELGATSKVPMGNLRQLSDYRRFHIVVSTAEGVPQVAPSASQELIDVWLAPVFSEIMVPIRYCFIGVELRGSTAAAAHSLGTIFQRSAGSASKGKLREAVRSIGEGFDDLLGNKEVDLSPYSDDMSLISGIIGRATGVIPSARDIDQLLAWYNDGQYADVPFKINAKDHTHVRVERPGGQTDTYEMAALVGFSDLSLPSPLSQWVEASMVTEGEASMVSIRGEFEPYEMVRSRLKRSKTKMLTEIKQMYETGQIDEGDEQRMLAEQEALTDDYASTKEPMITRLSVIFGRKVRGRPDRTYIDMLRTNFGIKTKPLEYRQVPAILHSLPCSQVELSPLAADALTQEVSLAMLSHAGLPSFSALGDSEGLLLGLTMPHYTLCYMDPMLAASGEAASQAPLLGIFGDTGSGKTWVGQSIAVQAYAMGMTTVFINPKGGDREQSGGSLAAMAEAVGGRIINLTNLNEIPGALDPFKYIPDPEMAARVLNEFINDVLGPTGAPGYGLNQEQTAALMDGLQRGAASGARCAVDALRAVSNEYVRNLVGMVYNGSAPFRLALSETPLYSEEDPSNIMGRSVLHSGFTLIEFGRDLALPPVDKPRQSMSMPELINVAVLRLASRVSLELLLYAGKGGMFVLDEANTFMNSAQGRTVLDRLGRQGRSQRVTAALMTQKVSDLESLEGFFGRVLAMKLEKPAEAAAALRHCGLQATKARVESMRNFGPEKPSIQTGNPGRPSVAYHKDLHGRASMVLIAPTPDPWNKIFSTSYNREESSMDDRELVT